MISDRRIFSSRHAFCGRDRELERVVDAAFRGRSLAVTGPQGIGKSELLRQACDELFDSENKLPIYFRFRPEMEASVAARRFARDVLTQAAAFRLGDADISRFSPSLGELAERVGPRDAWFEQCIRAIEASTDGEIPAVALALPGRLSADGVDVCVFLDDVELADTEILKEIERQVEFGHTSIVVSAENTQVQQMLHLPAVALEPLSTDAASEMIGSMADELGVTMVDATRDLIAVQLEGMPGDILALLSDASDAGRDLNNFLSVERAYVDSLARGRLAKRSLSARASADREELLTALSRKGSVRAAVIGDTIVRMLERAPALMSAHYRSLASIGVRSLLLRFHAQRVPTAVVSYRFFRDSFKGLDPDECMEALRTALDMFDLPNIAYAADAADMYAPLGEFSDRDRSAIGLTVTGEAWAVAEIDSKLEADANTAAVWCDRLELSAASAGYDKVRVWLIAPEGFDDDALTTLAERGAYGSSRRQIELLVKLLDEPAAAGSTYEITIPMGEEGELVANSTFCDIADRHAIPSKAAFQIKTALNEALINAAEHSLSPDRRVLLGFDLSEHQIRIRIENRGIRLADRVSTGASQENERRGWGLDLMRKMMDDVRIEPADDGTKLVMTKDFAPEIDR